MKGLIERAAKAIFVGLFLTGTSAIAGVVQTPESVPGEYVVKFKDNAVAARSLNTLTASVGSYVKDVIPNLNTIVIKRPVFETQSNVLITLRQNPSVEFIEPNYIYRASKVPNDVMFGQLWGMLNVGQQDSSRKEGVAGVDIGAEKAWDITTGSKDVIVAVIDTGVNYKHPDLADNMWTNEAELNGQTGVDDDGNGIVDDIYGANFVNADKPTGNPLDDNGHGSHCAGTIAGVGDNGMGVVGVAWQARVMGVKFLSGSGSGSLDGALNGIDYAVSMGAKVLSNSWGGGGYSDILKAAIERSHQANTLFVAAAGNESNNNDSSPTYPATYDVPNVLSVAAIDNRGKMASFSNYGKKSVHIAAPGVNIVSSVLGQKYDSFSGTSMATPHVSGVAVLLASAEPNLTGVEMKQRLMDTAVPIPGMKGKSVAGLVNAYKALTNEVAPPDESDPIHWKTVPYEISTPHPYTSKAKYEFEVTVEGATEIALYFEQFDTEAKYDNLKIYDAKGALVETLSGLNNQSFSQVIKGNYAKLVFTSDESVNKYGFDLTKVAWR